MQVSTIQTLKPNVTQEEAIRAFRSGLFSSAYLRVRNGPVQRLAAVYVPFWVYRVRYEIRTAAITRFFALDGVRGSLDLFEFPHAPGADELVETQTRNRLLPRLTEDSARDTLRLKVLRVLFQQGFFRMRALTLEIERVPLGLHLPYWLAFYGHGQSAKCRVLDAVRRRIEGAKAAAFFEDWLAA
jgi:hypothetical protein